MTAEAASWTLADQPPIRKVAENTLPFYWYKDYHLRSGERLEKETQQSSILRCVFGNPFRPTASDPAGRTSTAMALAAGVYEDRAFDRLPILADALEDAGCDNADVLAHCRGDGPHVRGCWVVDAILGKD